MNKTAIQAGIILFIGTLIFIILKPVNRGVARMELLPTRKKLKIEKPPLDEESMQIESRRKAYLCLCAYIDAYNDEKSDEELQSMKDEFKDQYGVIIYQDANLKLAVKDIMGNPILVNA